MAYSTLIFTFTYTSLSLRNKFYRSTDVKGKVNVYIYYYSGLSWHFTECIYRSHFYLRRATVLQFQTPN